MALIKMLISGMIVSSLHVSLCTGSILSTAVALAAGGALESPHHFCDVLRENHEEHYHHEQHDATECGGDDTCLLPSRHHSNVSNFGEFTEVISFQQNCHHTPDELIETKHSKAREGPFFEESADRAHCLVKRE